MNTDSGVLNVALAKKRDHIERVFQTKETKRPGKRYPVSNGP